MSQPETTAKDQDSSSSNSMQTIESSLIALPAAGLADYATKGNASSRARQTAPWTSRVPSTNPELFYPDEDRTFMLSGFRCPSCGWGMPVLERKIRLTAFYLIRCLNTVCQTTSPTFKSSTDAVRYWKALCLLTKP